VYVASSKIIDLTSEDHYESCTISDMVKFVRLGYTQILEHKCNKFPLQEVISLHAQKRLYRSDCRCQKIGANPRELNAANVELSNDEFNHIEAELAKIKFMEIEQTRILQN